MIFFHIKLTVLLLLFNIYNINGHGGHLIDDSEDLNSDTLQSRSSDYYRLACAGLNECVTISECPQILVEATKKCYSGDRSIFCGLNSNYEPLVCCPKLGGAIYHDGTVGGTNINSFGTSCGKSLVNGYNFRALGAYPFVVRVGFKNVNTGNLAYPCVGSIISRRVILSAAHCALAKADGHRLSSVRIGEYDTSRDPDCSESGFCAPPALNHAISHVIVHPDFQQGQYHHDIALLILRTPLNYSIAAQPICLQKSRQGLVVGKRATIIGWGKMSLSSGRSSQMEFLDVPLASWDSCLRVYGTSGALDSKLSIEGQWMCAGGEGKDACQGFGGAPLIIRDNDFFYQIGIMSFGSQNCGQIKIPSVYTSVAHFHQWITENIPAE